MVSTETLLSCPYWNTPFAVHNYSYYIQSGAVISQNNNPISFSQGDQSTYNATTLFREFNSR